MPPSTCWGRGKTNGNKYGHALHFWDLAAGKHLQRLDLGAHHQMVLELRPAHDPDATCGFVGVGCVHPRFVCLGLALASGKRQLDGGQGDHYRPRARYRICCPLH